MTLLISAIIITILWIGGYALYWQTSKKQQTLHDLISEVDEALKDK